MVPLLSAGAAALAAGLLSGCGSPRSLAGTTAAARPGPEAPRDLSAAHATAPVVVDGRLDDAVWANAPVYEMGLCADRLAGGDTPPEGGRVRFAWDADFLYLAVELSDSDVVAEGLGDGEHHYLSGDVAELFLWPEPQSWYWELYATPHNRQSSFFYPSPGRMVTSTFTDHLRLQVAATAQGTLNDWSDRDQGWTAEMAVPVKELTRRGEAWGPEASWRVLVGRYNYSVHLPKAELTCLPQPSRTCFHTRAGYARLRLLPPMRQEHATHPKTGPMPAQLRPPREDS
jgi:hypothetical protein